MQHIAPFVEKRIGFSDKHPVKRRLGLGVSLGGRNVTHLVIKQPKFFDKAFLVCPAISSIDYTNRNREFGDFFTRTNAYRPAVEIALRLMPSELRSPVYAAAVDPLIMGQFQLGPHTPPIFVQTSSKDEFGFNEGGRVFAMLARAKGVAVTFDEIKGRHCMMRPQMAVDFLSTP